MEGSGQECAVALLEWLRGQINPNDLASRPTQGSLFPTALYDENAPTIRSEAELAEALDHLEFAAFRRFHNQLSRAERARLDNSIENALFKIDRYLRCAQIDNTPDHRRANTLREQIREARDDGERRRQAARRADAKLAALATLSPEAFEEFVAELFESLDFSVQQVGGSGDEGADLVVERAGVRAIVQCKYHTRGVIGSPDLQRFLGSVHHRRCHKGFFVTTRTFSLAAERFAADNPIELIDGARLVELVAEALGPKAKGVETSWF